ncbi:MAG: hypothetical protein ACTSQ9_01700 [Candidatus Hodarchaeales archaeon]
MTNLDEFFSDDETRNVETLVAVTKKFFLFVSQLAEIVDSLEVKYANIMARLDRLDNLSQNAVQAPNQVSAPPVSPPPVTTSASVPTQAPSPPAAPPSAPTSLPTPPSFPTPPAPVEAQSASPPPVTAVSSPPQQQAFSPSNLPPLPGNAPAPPQPGLAPPGPAGGQAGGTRPPGTAPSPSPMSLKAQMNMELKEAFSRIRKGWDEEK